MSRGNNWVGLDKSLRQEFKFIRREFSMIEAMFSYSLDVDNGVTGSISGYSKLWGWSRNKVRRFIKNILSDKGHLRDSKRTAKGHAIHFIDKALWIKKDSNRTDKGQIKDSTINPISYKPKPETTKAVINYTISFIDSMCEKKGKQAPLKTDSLLKNSITTICDLITENGFEFSFIKNICDWAVKDDYFSTKFYSLARLKDDWGSNDLIKFQEMANSYDKKKNNVDRNGHFEENQYKGTPEDDITWLNHKN